MVCLICCYLNSIDQAKDLELGNLWIQEQQACNHHSTNCLQVLASPNRHSRYAPMNHRDHIVA
ncbi:hypothetical protein NC651_029436 [Populus alba x Populus x berolinensis]|nr:hypothetical protein NC651_029436 [Populus alba x Populus x berolinensis]